MLHPALLKVIYIAVLVASDPYGTTGIRAHGGTPILNPDAPNKLTDHEHKGSAFAPTTETEQFCEDQTGSSCKVGGTPANSRSRYSSDNMTHNIHSFMCLSIAMKTSQLLYIILKLRFWPPCWIHLCPGLPQ